MNFNMRGIGSWASRFFICLWSCPRQCTVCPDANCVGTYDGDALCVLIELNQIREWMLLRGLELGAVDYFIFLRASGAQPLKTGANEGKNTVVVGVYFKSYI